MMDRFTDLPKDIRFEILSRLPTESVLDCKLVAKPWKDVIRHPSFSNLHLKNHINSTADSGKLSFIFHNSDQGLKFYYTGFDDETLIGRKTTRMNLNPPFKNVTFVGSHNGLICLDTWYTSMSDNVRHCVPALICNPVTREFIMLPNAKGHYFWTGFGYTCLNNEYKVIRVCSDSIDPNYGVVQVYTLGNGSGWRNVGKMDMNTEYTRQHGAFANGALHFADDRQGTIHVFNLADEKFSEFSQPPCSAQGGDSYFSMELGVLCDCLSAAYYFNSGYCDVWLLKKNKDNDNDSSWSKEFSFRSYMQLPLELTKSGRLLFCVGSKIHSYDPKASSAKVVRVGKFISQAIHHKNTLVSLKELGEKDTKTMESGESSSSM